MMGTIHWEDRMRSFKMLLLLTVAGAVAVGCGGKKRIEGSEVPIQPQTQEQVQIQPSPVPVAAAPTAVPPQKYEVVKGDTLWGISGKDTVYGDSFQWPLIFKANRDQIQDPDLIYPQQEFSVRKDLNQAEVDKARKAASETPKYVPHTKPRETLPVDYF
jgi:nucleoid-associated protein YgaU